MYGAMCMTGAAAAGAAVDRMFVQAACIIMPTNATCNASCGWVLVYAKHHRRSEPYQALCYGHTHQGGVVVTQMCVVFAAARKEMGMVDMKHKKLGADVLRTLESVYSRTPFPSNEVIR